MSHFEEVHTEHEGPYKFVLSFEHETPDYDDFYCTKEFRQEILDDINSGKLMCFNAKIVCYKEGIELGIDYVGSCIYKSVNEFINDSYYSDMKAEALREAKANLIILGVPVDKL